MATIQVQTAWRLGGLSGACSGSVAIGRLLKMCPWCRMVLCVSWLMGMLLGQEWVSGRLQSNTHPLPCWGCRGGISWGRAWRLGRWIIMDTGKTLPFLLLCMQACSKAMTKPWCWYQFNSCGQNTCCHQRDVAPLVWLQRFSDCNYFSISYACDDSWYDQALT